MKILYYLLSVAQAHRGDGQFTQHMSPDCGMLNTGGSLLGAISMLLFWILAIVGIVYLVKHLAQDRNRKQRITPLDILKKRYANGEIDKDEFERKKKDLS